MAEMKCYGVRLGQKKAKPAGVESEMISFGFRAANGRRFGILLDAGSIRAFHFCVLSFVPWPCSRYSENAACFKLPVVYRVP
jgi:hypothetical protein